MSGLIDIRQLWANGLATLVRGERHWNYLDSPLTSTAWDGDSYSSTPKTLIDLSAVFGVPAGVRAVYVRVAIRDSGSAANDTSFTLGPTNAAGAVGMTVRCSGLANDAYTNANFIVPCDSNGDVYYNIVASGASTMDVSIQIWGWMY